MAEHMDRMAAMEAFVDAENRLEQASQQRIDAEAIGRFIQERDAAEKAKNAAHIAFADHLRSHQREPER